MTAFFSLKKFVVLGFTVVTLFAVAAQVRATSVTEYEYRVSSSRKLIDELRENEYEPVVAANLERVRQQLPPRESITLRGETVAVDNSWLHGALADFEQRSGGHSRAEVLSRISERLRALDEHLKEWQKAESAAANDKGADKGRLAEILRRPEYNKQAAEGSAFQRLIQRVLNWILSLFPKTKPLPATSAKWIGNVAQVFVILVCLAALVFLIWKFAPRFLQNRKKKKPKREARIVLGERLEPDQTAADLLADAERLARAGDLRPAIRKTYIALLCELGDRKMISLAQHKTNRDYLNSVRDKASLYSSLRKLTHSFELHWYGFKPALESDWHEFRSGYHQVLRTGPGV
jgi:hypothetical protein